MVKKTEITPDTMKRLPVPAGWRILMKLVEPEGAVGSIILPDATIEAQKYATMVGLVVSVGQLAFSGDRFSGALGWAVPGDFIMIAKFGGKRFKVDGEEYRIINDDEIIAVLPDPDAVAEA